MTEACNPSSNPEMAMVRLTTLLKLEGKVRRDAKDMVFLIVFY
jgi:hypothetical protein